MAYLLKKTFTKPLPDGAALSTRNGERIAKWSDTRGKTRTAAVTTGKDGADRIVVESAYWFGRYRAADGRVCEISTGCKSKDAAQARLNEAVARAEKIRAGIMTATEAATMDWAATPMMQHVLDFQADMEGRGLHRDYVNTTIAHLKSIMGACRFGCMADLSRSPVERWLNVQATAGMSARTFNVHVAGLTAFANWAVRNGRLMVNPFAGIRKRNERADRRRIRRALTPEEIARLLEAAERRPLEEALRGNAGRGKSMNKKAAAVSPTTRERLISLGQERRLVYKTLVQTGLRYGELRSITVAQVALDGPTPHIVLHARDEKARRGAQIPLPVDLAADLGKYLAEKRSRLLGHSGAVVRLDALTGKSKLFPSMPEQMTRIFDADLVAAGLATRDSKGKIVKLDEQGRTVDIHCLRHTFGTWLSQSGVPLQLVQRAMRHSDPKLTMNVYTHLTALDMAGAVAALPQIATKQGEDRQAACAGDESACTSLALLLALPTGNQVQAGAIPDKIDALQHSIMPVSVSDEKAGKTLGNGMKQHTAMGKRMERDTGFEPATSSLGSKKHAQDKDLPDNDLQQIDSGACTPACTSSPIDTLLGAVQELSDSDRAKLIKALLAGQPEGGKE